MPSSPLPTAEAAFRRVRSSARAQVRDAIDQFLASDPGLSRLRHGLRAVVILASAVGVQAAVAVGLGVPRSEGLLHVMLGAVVALNLATTMKETRRRPIAGTAVGAAGGAALGAGTAVVVAPSPVGAFSLFVLFTFVAVWVRRFGSRWFSTGFVMWQAYFFALFPASAALRTARAAARYRDQRGVGGIPAVQRPCRRSGGHLAPDGHRAARTGPRGRQRDHRPG